MNHDYMDFEMDDWDDSEEDEILYESEEFKEQTGQRDRELPESIISDDLPVLPLRGNHQPMPMDRFLDQARCRALIAEEVLIQCIRTLRKQPGGQSGARFICRCSAVPCAGADYQAIFPSNSAGIAGIGVRSSGASFFIHSMNASAAGLSGRWVGCTA